jgi:mannose-1-phosphate guanylyltransferase
MKNNKLITPLILAGGSGTRLWPISRKDKPKQFLEIFDSYSLLQLTALRCKNKIFNEPIFIVGEQHRFIVAEQLRTIGFTSPHIILEPEPKNTTAAITVGALYANNINLTEPLLVLPSDHYIEDTKEFVDLMHRTSKSNIKNKLICFGIQPTAPEIKYGYILKKNIDENDSLLKKINKFVEKPSSIKAKNLILRKALWNSGMFFFNADSIINEIKL